jgi:hypothetical protein
MIKKILLATLLAFSAVACGGNDCDDAVDKLDECGATEGLEVDGDAECSGAAECTSKCINDATCDELENGSEKLSGCMADCIGTG